VPELPDLTVYLEALEARVLGRPLERVRIASPFVLRTVEPPLAALEGQPVRALRRLGKRLVFCFDDERFLALHLMVAGRLRWKACGAPVPRRLGLAAFDFPTGTAILTEASKQKRAALHVLQGEAALAGLSAGGLEVLGTDLASFRRALTRERHTLKRTLTDPHILAGIGNAYSDEILHRARLSPVRLTDRLTDDEVVRLFDATRATLTEWTARLRAQVGDGFPDKVTAFRPDMAVHGRYGQPCPTCGAPVQRIVHAQNETNYCAPCQTDGKLLADRSLSRLLHADWPRTLDEMEERRETASRRAPDAPEPA
jgi:formamidopyrimidine-DNA glycosylase